MLGCGTVVLGKQWCGTVVMGKQGNTVFGVSMGVVPWLWVSKGILCQE